MKNLIVLTTARSDYYLLKPLICRLKKSKKISIEIITTGSHLMKDQGFTYKIVENDFGITKKIKFSNVKTNKDLAKVISPSVQKFNKVFKKINSDGVVILGDRYEAFIAAINKQKPASAKGRFYTNAAVSLTMSPSINVDASELMDIK